ncbi:pre-rRNA processing [Savitreella phatthalungensis]
MDHTQGLFWTGLSEITAPRPDDDESTVEPKLERFLSFASTYGPDHLDKDSDVERCCRMVLDSEHYAQYTDAYRQLLITFEAEDGTGARGYIVLYMLLLDGRKHARTFRLMSRAGVVENLVAAAKDNAADAYRFTRLILVSLYELCRAQKISRDDLLCFDTEFSWFLLRNVELARDESDPFSYITIKLMLALNEQYMVAALPSGSQEPFSRQSTDQRPALEQQRGATAVDNAIVKVLSDHGSRFKAFGENVIRMLNRERDPILQLLILKQLFLIFTNPTTHEYFFTNDLHVLVDVFIRELYDLPQEHESLRHTYLRVLHPLLTNTQLRNSPHYKAAELVKLLNSLNKECSHFGPVGATTVRLLARCLTVPWLLPPRKRRLKIPRPSFTSSGSNSSAAKEAKSKASLLGISLGQVDSTSQASIRSFDSISSVARSKPPPPPPPPVGGLKPGCKTSASAVALKELSTVLEGVPADAAVTSTTSRLPAPPAPKSRHGVAVGPATSSRETESGASSPTSTTSSAPSVRLAPPVNASSRGRALRPPAPKPPSSSPNSLLLPSTTPVSSRPSTPQPSNYLDPVDAGLVELSAASVPADLADKLVPSGHDDEREGAQDDDADRNPPDRPPGMLSPETRVPSAIVRDREADLAREIAKLDMDAGPEDGHEQL